MTRHDATSPAVLLALLAGIGLFNSLCSDMYLPALRALAVDLNATSLESQQTVSLFFLACAFMSLWHGAIADAYGRRRAVLASLAVLGVASLAATAVTRIDQMWALRTLQGLAAGSGVVISRAIVLDIHRGFAAQRLLSQITLVQTIAPVIMPLIGGWLTVAFGWRAVFLFIGAITTLMWLATWRWLPETLPRAHRRPLHPVALARAYRDVLSSASFLRLAVTHVANWVSMMVYVVAAPAFVIGLLGRDETAFYLVYAPMMFGMMTGFLLFPHLAHRLRPQAVLAIAYGILGIAVALNLGVSWNTSPGLHNVVPLFVFAIGLALAMPVLIGQALDPFSANSGVASSCHAFLQFAATGVVAGALVPLLWGSVWRLALGSGGLAAIGALALWWEFRSRADGSPPPSFREGSRGKG